MARDINELDQETQDYLAEVIRKAAEPDLITAEEKAFIRARRDYIPRKQQEQLKSILGEKVDLSQDKGNQETEKTEDPNKFPGDNTDDDEVEEE